MGISGSELVVLLLVGFLVVGPEKLPELSRQLARVVRKVVAVARDTGDKVRAELGDDFDDLKDLDPRQYDPRRIVADAMRQPEPGGRGRATSGEPARAPTTARVAGGSAATASGAAIAGATPATTSAFAGTASTAAVRDRRPERFDGRLTAPHDPDAT